MRISFIADTVTYDEIDNILIAGVAARDSNQYLIFQRSLLDTIDDEGVYLEVNEQANSGYEAISACRVSSSKLELDLKKSLGNLQDVTGFDIELKTDSSTYNHFEQGVQKIFRGETKILEICS